MRLLAICAALVGAATLITVITVPAPVEAQNCYPAKAIAATKTPMSKLPPPQACFDGQMVQIKGVAYCVHC